MVWPVLALVESGACEQVKRCLNILAWHKAKCVPFSSQRAPKRLEDVEGVFAVDTVLARARAWAGSPAQMENTEEIFIPHASHRSSLK